jgi:O-antigen/teichoic acid export membrane protein
MLDAIEKKVNQRTPESLSTKVARGGLWVFALRIINRGLGFVRTIILARLLAPEDFGLLGIAMLSLSTLEIFSQTGFHTALIQKKGNVESYLDTVWTVSAVRGTILFFLLFLSAPLIAKFFNSSGATLVIKVVAISTFLAGFRNIGILFFRKDLEFNKEFYYEIPATLVDLTVAISLAFILRNVWALVWAGLAANLTRLLMSYIVHPYRPKIRLRKEEFQELFGFGKWVASSSILIFLLTQGDDILVGKILGVAPLGFYQMAYTFSNLPATEITHVISRVTFPAYSSLQDDLPRLREAYLRVLQLTALISLPAGGAIFILAPQFTITFLGEKWIPMVPAMQALCIFGVTRSINATFGSLLESVGRPEIITKTAAIQLVLMVIIIFPLTTKWGLLGTALAVILPNFYAFVAYYIILSKILKCKYSEFAKLLLLPLVNIGVMILFITSAKALAFNGENVISFIALALIGIIPTFVVTWVLDRVLGCGFQQNLNRILHLI